MQLVQTAFFKSAVLKQLRCEMTSQRQIFFSKTSLAATAVKLRLLEKSVEKFLVYTHAQSLNVKHCGGPLDNRTWWTEWKTAPLARVQLCEYENQTLKVAVVASRPAGRVLTILRCFDKSLNVVFTQAARPYYQQLSACTNCSIDLKRGASWRILDTISVSSSASESVVCFTTIPAISFSHDQNRKEVPSPNVLE